MVSIKDIISFETKGNLATIKIKKPGQATEKTATSKMPEE